MRALPLLAGSGAYLAFAIHVALAPLEHAERLALHGQGRQLQDKHDRAVVRLAGKIQRRLVTNLRPRSQGEALELTRA